MAIEDNIRNAIEGVGNVLGNDCDINSDVDARLQLVYDDLIEAYAEMCPEDVETLVEGELVDEPEEDELPVPRPLELEDDADEYEPDVEPAVEGDEDDGGPPEGIMSSYTG